MGKTTTILTTSAVNHSHPKASNSSLRKKCANLSCMKGNTIWHLAWERCCGALLDSNVARAGDPAPNPTAAATRSTFFQSASVTRWPAWKAEDMRSYTAKQ